MLTPAKALSDHIILHSWKECQRDKKAQAANFKHIEQQSNRFTGATLWQQH